MTETLIIVKHRKNAKTHEYKIFFTDKPLENYSTILNEFCGSYMLL